MRIRHSTIASNEPTKVNAALVSLRLSTRKDGEEEAYARRRIDVVDGLPSFFPVRSDRRFAGERIATASGLKASA